MKMNLSGFSCWLRGFFSSSSITVPSGSTGALGTVIGSEGISPEHYEYRTPLQPAHSLTETDLAYLRSTPVLRVPASRTRTGEEDSETSFLVKQLRFLLSQAPMLDAPLDAFSAGRAVTKFAYIHPKTFSKFYFVPIVLFPKTRAFPAYVLVPPSPTRWVVTTLMPEGRVLYTPNALPGIEKLIGA